MSHLAEILELVYTLGISTIRMREDKAFLPMSSGSAATPLATTPRANRIEVEKRIFVVQGGNKVVRRDREYLLTRECS
jgi:hypothetical protein